MAALQWFFVPALAAIGANVTRSTQAFTASDVSQWATNEYLDFSVGSAELALTSLQRSGFVQSRSLLPQRSRQQRIWHATTDGLRAARAALQSLPGSTPDVQALPTRLWNLLRIRRRLTAVEAAETLIDAADNFDAQTKRIGALLAAWAKLPPHAVVTGAKKEEGRIRYVLVKDLGRWPPPSQTGQMHPTAFAYAVAVPARFRKTRSATPHSQGEGHEAA